MCFAPSAFRALSAMLRKRNKLGCQRLLTVGVEVWGSVPDALQCLVDLEHICDVLCTLGLKIIARDAAKKEQTGVSMAADSQGRGVGQLT